MEAFHIKKTFNNLSNLIFLCIIIFNLFTHHVNSQQCNLSKQNPDSNGWIFMRFREFNVFAELFIVDEAFIGAQTHDVFCYSVNIDLFRSKLGYLSRGSSIITSVSICSFIIIFVIISSCILLVQTGLFKLECV